VELVFKYVENSPIMTVEEIEEMYAGYSYLALDKMDNDLKYKGVVVAIASQDDISKLLDLEREYSEKGVLTFTGVGDNMTVEYMVS
jgi:hypothetical protein